MGNVSLYQVNLKKNKRWSVNAFLSEQEKEIFIYLLEQKFMTLEQIAKKIYGGSNSDEKKMESLYHRFWRLDKYGYICTAPGIEEKKTLYLLAERGLETLGSKDCLSLVSNINYDFVSHDLAATDCRILLERIGFLAQWTSDRRLQAGNPNARHLPDALFSVKGFMVALEVEFSLKSKDRYEEIASFYASKDPIKMVMYVVKDEGLLTTLRRHLTDPKFFFCTYQKLISFSENTEFVSANDRFRIGELCFPVKEKSDARPESAAR